MQYKIKTEMLNTQMYDVIDEHLKTMGISLDQVVEAFVYSLLRGDPGAGNFSRDEKQAAEDLIHVALEWHYRHDLEAVKTVYRPFDNRDVITWDEEKFLTPKTLKGLNAWRKQIIANRD